MMKLNENNEIVSFESIIDETKANEHENVFISLNWIVWLVPIEGENLIKTDFNEPLNARRNFKLH